MKPRLSLLFCIFLMALACSKDNSQTGPTIKLKSYNDQIYNGNSFTASLTFSQNGGNISGDSLLIFRRRYNQSYVPTDEIRDFFGTILAQTPGASQADFSASLDWSFIEYGINGENDTCDFRFVVKDQNGNLSDTVTTGIVIIYQ